MFSPLKDFYHIKVNSFLTLSSSVHFIKILILRFSELSSKTYPHLSKNCSHFPKFTHSHSQISPHKGTDGHIGTYSIAFLICMLVKQSVCFTTHSLTWIDCERKQFEYDCEM